MPLQVSFDVRRDTPLLVALAFTVGRPVHVRAVPLFCLPRLRAARCDTEPNIEIPVAQGQSCAMFSRKAAACDLAWQVFSYSSRKIFNSDDHVPGAQEAWQVGRARQR